jgi:predicted  nucleic acid-binding Zn-ribbon protein
METHAATETRALEARHAAAVDGLRASHAMELERREAAHGASAAAAAAAAERRHGERARARETALRDELAEWKTAYGERTVQLGRAQEDVVRLEEALREERRARAAAGVPNSRAAAGAETAGAGTSAEAPSNEAGGAARKHRKYKAKYFEARRRADAAERRAEEAEEALLRLAERLEELEAERRGAAGEAAAGEAAAGEAAAGDGGETPSSEREVVEWARPMSARQDA